ncbi:MAG: YhcN/YlaJ family sporulation lipoprotein [Bacillota bacterium]
MLLNKRAALLVVLVLTAMAFFVSGCEDVFKKPVPDKSNREKSQTQDEAYPEIAEKAKQTAVSVKGVRDTTAVVIDKEISLAVKVTGFDRLRLKKIKQEIHKKLEQEQPGHTIYITTDKKLFAELKKIESRITGGPVPPDIKRRVDKINEDM